MTDDLRLHGMKAVVTGAAEGIGEAICLLFAKHGVEVLAVDLPSSRIEQTFRRRDSIISLGQDVAEPNAVEVIFEAVSKRLGGLDILVNNAGVCPTGPVESLRDEDWQRAFDVNVTAMLRLCRAAIPLLKKSSGGRIINIGSIMSTFGSAGLAAYTASKHAVAGLTKTLACELGEFGITANYLQPGAIMTGMTREVFKKDKEFRDFWIRKSAAGRLGEPLDVAKVALFLASDDAAFVSGQGLLVDGGAMQAP